MASERNPDAPVALITGAGSGIGAATASRLARDGIAVALLDVDGAALGRVAKAIAADGGRALALTADVASPEDWRAAVAATREQLGRVSILHSNAAWYAVAPAHELDPADWERTLAVSLGATHLALRELADDLRATRGSVILTSSVHAGFGIAGHAAYAAAKGGLVALARQLAVEYAPDVRVNAILPGPVVTPLWNGLSNEARAGAARSTVLGRMGRADEVAAVVAFLASEEASFVTGAAIPVDGGWMIHKESA